MTDNELTIIDLAMSIISHHENLKEQLRDTEHEFNVLRDHMTDDEKRELQNRMN